MIFFVRFDNDTIEKLPDGSEMKVWTKKIEIISIMVYSFYIR